MKKAAMIHMILIILLGLLALLASIFNWPKPVKISIGLFFILHSICRIGFYVKLNKNLKTGEEKTDEKTVDGSVS